jgi:hypothetical protein
MPRHVAATTLAIGIALGQNLAHAEPSVKECIDANEQSIAMRSSHRLQDARKSLLTCAATTCPGDIRVECARRLDEVDAAIPTIVFEAKDTQGNDLIDVRVAMDGVTLVDKLDGTMLKLDPGPHEFVFTSPSRQDIKRTIVLRESDKDRHERLIFKAIGAVVVPPTDGMRHDPVRRGIGIGTAVLGLVGIGVGAFLGARASSLWSTSQSECGSPASCTNHDQAVSDHDAAVGMALGSTIAFIAGGALLVAGGVVFFTAPYVSPAKGGSAGINLGASF